MPRVFANHHDAPISTNDFAFVTNRLDTWINFHVVFLFAGLVLTELIAGEPFLTALLIAIDNTASGEIVWAQLNNHAIFRKNTDVVLSHLARDVGKNFVSVGQLNAKHRVGKSFDHCALDFDDTVFFGHNSLSLSVIVCWSCG